jgi:hypothetical protein
MVSGTLSQKTFEPDANGVFGGMQGVGSLEAIGIYGQ